MSKINNTQRAAFVKMLNDAREKFRHTQDGRINLYRYEFSPSKPGDARLTPLVKKYALDKLRAASDAAKKRFDDAFEQLEAEVDAYNDQMVAKREAELEEFTGAIRDVWASDMVDDAKSIVAKFAAKK